MKLFLFLCFAPLLLLLYFVTRNEAKPKNNLILSTTLPKEAWETPQVLAIVRQFRRSLAAVCLLLALLLVPTFFLSYLSVLITYYMVWVLALTVVPGLPYCHAVRKLRALKRQYWPQPKTVRVQVADTRITEQTFRTPAPISFFLPFLLSLVPMLYPLAVPSETSYAACYLIWGSNAACILLFGFCCRFLLRRKPDRVNADTALTSLLTHIRIRGWSQFWLSCSWLSVVFSFALLLFHANEVLYLVFTVLFLLLLCFVTLKTEFAVRRAQQHYNRTEPSVILADEDDFWWNGILYYNKSDSSFLVPNRIGMGTTVNAAHPAGKAFLGFALLLLLTLPFFGISLIREEFTDVRVELTEDQVRAYHCSLEYAVPLDHITECRLLTELPATSKNSGTNMTRVYKGSFSVKGIDRRARLCLNPEADLFLLLSADGRTYLFSMGENGDASRQALQEIYQAITERLP